MSTYPATEAEWAFGGSYSRCRGGRAWVRHRGGLAIVVAMDELGDDLLLLAVRPDGTLTTPPKLRFGLSGSELVRLAAARRVDIMRGRIAILDTAPTGDALLDEALASMAAVSAATDAGHHGGHGGAVGGHH